MKRLELSDEEKEILLKEYPFLQVYSHIDGKPIEGLNYIDDVPSGWLNIFKEFLPKLKAKLIEIDFLDKYKITQIKEKFGYFHLYDNCAHPEINSLIQELEQKSEKTCIICGEPAKYISLGWISPYCEECKNYISEKMSDGGMDKGFKEIDNG